ncbi:MAG TPA: (2Fe-2S) ferredoxin domain-containing protein [Bacteroidales bacterium]|jgi:NADP-reducing hydrogenase subunit HndB|nr:NADP oxidoreductase [Rikenellaceae bacterium]HON55142.1 (2Fe-2S) ferredoxin domain-containing protein [Bacteroidales bacterium]HRR49977.1 (2Fe-2S) ferredoxin domain-containing protein [Bacteroidales bacterium]HRT34068.1 (2Fe-2S) ferredoxin domain-containing protein [Bacteroidales bacterium]HRT84702.1 (2Fe-2S) ferredoxin domain-containing protein [Bacteroidales bacterium]
MNKIKSIDDLRKIKQDLENGMNIREKSNSPESLVQIRVAMATCGIAAGARTVMNTLIEKIEKDKVPAVVTQSGCMGYCYAEPTVEVRIPGKDPVVFGYVDSKKAIDIVEKYIVKGELLDGIIPVNYQTINDKI